MDRLTLNVAGLLQATSGTSRHIEIDGFHPRWEEISLVKPIRGAVDLVRAGKGIVVSSDLCATIELSCCRCLEAFDQDVLVQFEEMYYPVLDLATGKALRLEFDDIDSEFLIENVDRLDLSEAVRQHIEISKPLMPRCQPECLGICPECGADRNSSLCTCEAEAIDVRMAPLQEIIRQMGQKRPA